jgi:DNA-binding protein H-NS
MHSMLNPKQTDPRRVLVARMDEELAHTFNQIADADEQIARVEEQLSKLEHEAPRHPSDHPQTRMNTLRPAVASNRPSPSGRAVRGFTALMLTACICVAAFVWQSSYGDAARQIVATWAPQLVSTASPPLQNPGLPTQPSGAGARMVAAQATSPQAAALAPTVSQDVAPTAAALSPELTRLLQPMARDLTSVKQEIEQLKANQEQMARDNANAAEQLKASQEQMARVIAKASEQNLRPQTSASPPRSTAAPTRKPAPTLPPQQTGARAHAPVQLQPEEQ